MVAGIFSANLDKRLFTTVHGQANVAIILFSKTTDFPLTTSPSLVVIMAPIAMHKCMTMALACVELFTAQRAMSGTLNFNSIEEIIVCIEPTDDVGFFIATIGQTPLSKLS